MTNETKSEHTSLSLKTSVSSTSSPKNDSNSIPNYPYCISPSTIPGILHMSNYGAMDWAPNGLIAYGCQNKIIIVDANNSMTYVQCELFSILFYKKIIVFFVFNSFTSS